MSVYKLEIEIAGLPSMTNTSRVHWRVIHRERERWKQLVADAVLIERGCAARQRKPLSRAKVTIVRCSSTEPDYDGLVSGGKALLDGLVVAKVITDDKVSVIGQPTYLWEKAKPRQGKIKITVEET